MKIDKPNLDVIELKQFPTPDYLKNMTIKKY